MYLAAYIYVMCVCVCVCVCVYIYIMGYLKDKILNSLVEKPLVWWRYIDDIFMIWQHGEEKLKKVFKNT